MPTARSPPLSDEALATLNETWLYWMRELDPCIRNYAFDDEDLAQEGFLALRAELVANIHASRQYLLRSARVAVYNAYSHGSSVDSRKSENHNNRSRKGGIELVSLDADRIVLSSPTRYAPDVLAVDRVAYAAFRDSLSLEEASLLDLMRKMSDLGQRGANYRQAFVREAGISRWEYEKITTALRLRFYEQFGSPEERSRFEATYRETLGYEGRTNPRKERG